MKEFMGRFTFPGCFPFSISFRRSSTGRLTYASMSTIGTWVQDFVSSLSGFSSLAIFFSPLIFSLRGFLSCGDADFVILALLFRGSGRSGRVTARPLLVRMVSLSGVDIDGVGGVPAGASNLFGYCSISILSYTSEPSTHGVALSLCAIGIGICRIAQRIVII